MIYIIVGKSCSGKTSAKEYLESKGMICFEASEYMKRYISRYNLTPEELFIKFGKDFVSKLIFEEILKLEDNTPIVISGLRTPEEIIFLKNKGNVRVIGLNVTDNLCFERNLERNREDIITDFPEFVKKRIEFNSRIGLDIVFNEHVDVWVDNQGTLTQLESSLNKFIGEKNETD